MIAISFSLRSMALEMNYPYIRSAHERLSDANSKIILGLLYVARRIGETVNDVRERKRRERIAVGDGIRSGLRCASRSNRANRNQRNAARFELMQGPGLMVTRRSAPWKGLRPLVRPHAPMHVPWMDEVDPVALRTRFVPMKREARMIKQLLRGILSAIARDLRDAKPGSVNSKIQGAKRLAYGVRTRSRIRTAINVQ